MGQMAVKVLIVGGGPVGLTVAMDLAWRGIPVVVVESRAPGEPPSVKCNHVSARPMEIFRRLGVAQAVRNTGLPPDYPNDAAFRITTTGAELARIPIPCRRDRYTHRRTGYLVADAGATASYQSDLSRTGAVRACEVAPECADSEPHAAHSFRATCLRCDRDRG